MITANNLKISYRQNLFDNLSFKLVPGDKVGLVGLNGSGKTTLLRIIIGAEQPDSGYVDTQRERIAYLPQEFELPDEMVGEFLESLVANPKSEMYKVTKILHKLGLEDIDIYQNIRTMSYGQQMKLYITKLLIDEPTVLLLDEPTNHLDLPGIMWVEEFVQNFEGMCVVISHDRAFLNNVTNKIWEIDEHKLWEFTGNYDAYLDQKEVLLGRRAIDYEQQERKRQKFEDRIKLIQKFSSGKKQSKQLSSTRARLEREVTRNEISAYQEQRIQGLKLAGEVHQTKQILKVEDVSFSYPSHELLDHANFTMHGNEKLWLFGANGIGKSTLIKLIIGELQPDSGTVKIGDNLKWAYFAQDQANLKLDETVQDYFTKRTNVSFSQSFGTLQKFLFPRELLTQKLKLLSPGQRARLAFAVFAQQELDFLILDEPTNHLDIRSKEVIEEAFRNYKGAMLLISHDRYFVENLEIDRTVTIEDKEIIAI